MEKKTYQVGATPLLLNGERAEPGDIVELTDKEAAGLAGHVAPAPVSEPAPASEPAPEPEPAVAEPTKTKQGGKK